MYKRGLHGYAKQVNDRGVVKEGLWQDERFEKDGAEITYDKESFRAQKIDFEKYCLKGIEIEYTSDRKVHSTFMTVQTNIL